MHRRRLLAGAIGFPFALAGCLDGSAGTATDQSGTERYELHSLSVETERTAPEHRYTVRTRKRYTTVDADATVVSFDELDEPIRTTLEAALDRPEYETDELPDGLRTVVEEYDFVDCTDCETNHRYLGFEILTVDLDDPPRLAIDAHLVDPVATPDEPAVIELVAENDGEVPLVWHTGVPAPFGILRTDGDLLLWTNEYEESGHVGVTDGEITGADGIAIEVGLEPGESIAERYELQPERDDFEPGSFALTESFATELEGGRETVAFSLEWDVRKDEER